MSSTTQSFTTCHAPGMEVVTTAEDWHKLKNEMADAEKMHCITTLIIYPSQESTSKWQGPALQDLEHVLTCSKLQTLEDLQLIGCNGLKQLPIGITRLEQLRQLVVCDCSHLEQLPPSMETLSKLERLAVTTCKKIRALPDGLFSRKNTELIELKLRGCQCLRSLPACIGELPALESLDLTDCGSLEEVASLQECKNLQQVAFLNCKELHKMTGPGLLAEVETAGKDTSMKMKDVIKRLDRHRSIIELANNQQRMLETLERMSWIAVLLATATFIGFLQLPYGAVKNDQLIEWSSAVQAFFVLDTWSFLASLTSLVMIVELSLPRLRSRCKKREAGRFWLLLVFAWSGLYLAVSAGCGAFVASAFAMYDVRTASIWVPTCLSALLVCIGVCIGCQRFANLYPGLESIILGLAEIWQRDLPFHRLLPCDGLLACISCQSYVDKRSQSTGMQRQDSVDNPDEVHVIEVGFVDSCVDVWRTFLIDHNIIPPQRSLHRNNSSLVRYSADALNNV